MPRTTSGFAQHRLCGPAHPRWKGGEVLRVGYRCVRMVDHPGNHHGYVFVHRLVMEEILGRYLQPGETVHHINGDRFDNRPENLQVVTHREHGRIHNGNDGEAFEKYDNEAWLREQAVDLNRPVSEIAREIKCSYKHLRHRLDILGIRKIVPGQTSRILYPQLRNEKWLRKVSKTKSQAQISRIVGCTSSLILHYQRRFGISPKGND